VIGVGTGPAGGPLGVAPAHAKNPVGKFFNRVGDAIAKNPLNKRSKRNKARNRAPADDQAGEKAGEPAFSVEQRKRIQARLNELGYKVGSVDGLFGAGTRRGIARYQASIGAGATGILTQAQADTLLSGGSAPVDQTPARNETAGGNPAPAPAPGQPAQEIAGPDAVWASAAMNRCNGDEWLACMERFGAPEAALAFVRLSGEAGLEPGMLAGFEDFGTVDLADMRFSGPADRRASVLVNGGPPTISTKTDAINALSLNDPVYRRLVSRYGELKLLGEPRLESHRLMTRGGQRFVFAYRLAKCQACATPGEMLAAFDFDVSGSYKGLSLTGIASRDPDQDWLSANSYKAAELQADTTLLQRRLAGLGFAPGSLDGKGGKKLEAALIAFQTDHGLTQSGEADERTAGLLATSEIIIEVSRFEQIYRIAAEPDLIAFALQYGHGVLGRAERTLTGADIVLARMNSRIARLHDRRKDFAGALPFAQKAVAKSVAAGQAKSQSHALMLFNLGETYRQLGQREDALENFDAAFDLLEPLAMAEQDGPVKDGSAQNGPAQNLAAEAFQRTGRKLIALYEEMGKTWSARHVNKRLETVEAKLAAAQ
jgi:peptidoglycan hydrolase-like protein with peptidoglycan-binding domain